MWLRFGVTEDAVDEYVKAIGAESGLDVIVHVYPAGTRAAYSTRLMVRLAGLPQVAGFKPGGGVRAPASPPSPPGGNRGGPTPPPTIYAGARGEPGGGA
jgi:hypothetical protein